LLQVLTNLIVNSIQAMPNGGRLTISTSSRDGNLLLTIEDTGIGMSDEVTKKIFNPFFTTKDIDEGTGLGLSVVHGIVTSHGGTIEVESEVGRGTKFTVRLPVQAMPSEKGIRNG
jgi:signal transduction histidine kinase